MNILKKETHLFVTIELITHKVTTERAMDEALADTIYNLGGEVKNISEYTEGKPLNE